MLNPTLIANSTTCLFNTGICTRCLQGTLGIHVYFDHRRIQLVQPQKILDLVLSSV